MDILHKIEILIDNLTNRPQVVSLDNIRLTFLEAREAIANGLNRSQTGKALSRLEDELSSLRDEGKRLREDNSVKAAQVKAMTVKASIFEPIFEKLKERALSLLDIAYSNSPDLSGILKARIKDATPEQFLQIQAEIEERVKGVFSDPVETLRINGGQFAENPNHYRIGG